MFPGQRLGLHALVGLRTGTEPGLHGITVFVAPGFVMLMVPPQLHMHLEFALSAGMFLTITLGEPGVHGAIVIGTQGIGVSTPAAAAVAAATCGFAGDLHTPNGLMFTIGL